METQQFGARVQFVVQGLVQVGAMGFLIVYGLQHDGSLVLTTILPAFLGVLGFNALTTLAGHAVQTWGNAQQAKLTASGNAPPPASHAVTVSAGGDVTVTPAAGAPLEMGR